jgi:hypothetical protein
MIVSKEGTKQIVANLRAEGQTSRADYVEAMGERLERVRELAAVLQAEWDEMDQEELMAEVA